MGILILGNAGSDKVLEYNTSVCIHCNAAIIYKTLPSGKRLRITRKYGKEQEEYGNGFFCMKCAGDICYHCGERATKGALEGPCNSMKQLIDKRFG
jgi:hypothetical protein|tara:strand:- start:5388 stop:5675 length:288 start_codon:yes stop_codon:yes gene_type:complete